MREAHARIPKLDCNMGKEVDIIIRKPTLFHAKLSPDLGERAVAILDWRGPIDHVAPEIWAMYV
jgi:hypothetical protein